jgi:hypothetical protein
MDTAIRQKLQKALEMAMANEGSILVERTDGTFVAIELDLICYETQVEATGKDGTWVTIPYGEIAEVRVG